MNLNEIEQALNEELESIEQALSEVEQPTFTLKAQDISADLVVDFWIVINGRIKELIKAGMALPVAVQYMRNVYHLPPLIAGLLTDEKERSALRIADAMRAYPYRKVAG